MLAEWDDASFERILGVNQSLVQSKSNSKGNYQEKGRDAQSNKNHQYSYSPIVNKNSEKILRDKVVYQRGSQNVNPNVQGSVYDRLFNHVT